MVLWKVYGEGCRRQHNGLPRLRFAQVVSKTQVIATRLFVGFSDDGRVVLPVLVLFRSEGCRRQHNGLPRLRFAQVVSKTQVIATRLFVGFSDDGRVVLPVLVLF